MISATYKKILFISTHSDDIALSVGCLLAFNALNQLFCPKICTIYSTSNHAPYILEKDPVVISQIRLCEDKKYSSKVSAEFVSFDFKEAMLRGYPDLASLFDTKTKVMNDSTYHHVNKKIHHLLSIEKPYITFFPSAIGNHIEHRILKSIGDSLDEVLFYEDVPYAADYSSGEIKKRMSPTCQSLSIMFKNIEQKIENLLECYPSQVSNTEVNKIFKYQARKNFQSNDTSLNLIDVTNETIFLEKIWGKQNAIDKFMELFY